jgi:hypothetical protein
MNQAANLRSNGELAGRLLGEILVTTAGVAPERVEEALAAQRAGGSLRLGEILVRSRAVAEADVLRAVALQAEFRTVVAHVQSDKGASTVLPEPRRSPLTRLFSLAALAAVAVLGSLAVSATYRAFTDSYVAPMTISPDSDVVVQNKLNLSRLESERQRLQARVDEDAAAIEAAQRSVRLLKGLQAASAARSASPGFGDGASGEARVEGRRELLEVLDRQEKYVAGLQRDLAAGLIRESDLVREQNALNHTRVALLQDQRENLSATMQLARLDMDVVKGEAELRARQTQRHATEEELARLDKLLGQLRQRPFFRAVETSQNLAFVPYSQIDGVRPGAAIYRCELWGLFGCVQVGKISEVVPGEAVSQDPWGSSTRGEYALLDLTEKSAAQYRSLRVRPIGSKADPQKAAVSSRN